MLEVRDLPVSTQWASAPVVSRHPRQTDNWLWPPIGMNFQAMETPLVMSGFRPEAIRLWQKEMAGTGLDIIAAGGGSGSSKTGADGSFGRNLCRRPSPALFPDPRSAPTRPRRS